MPKSEIPKLLLVCCPICGDGLRARQIRDLHRVIAGPSGQVVAGEVAGPETFELSCEAGHTWPEMAAALPNVTPKPPKGTGF